MNGGSQAAPAPKPGEDMLGEYGDLFGNAQMANHVPRLGRRSLSPFDSKHRNGFRFFGDGGDLQRSRNLAGFFGPVFNPRYENFRYYGGRPGEELARGLLRDKKQDEYALPLQTDKITEKEDSLPSSESSDTKATKPEAIDQDYWSKVIGEATINSVLEKMAEIGETSQIIEDFNNYEATGVGNPLPKYLARWNHPVNTPKYRVPQPSIPKYKSFYPKSSAFPRRKKGRTFTRIFSRR